MADRELELIEQIPREKLAHFDDLEGIEPLEGVIVESDEKGWFGHPDRAILTSFSADDVIFELKLWHIPYRLYRSDWATHNRNETQGWGPYNGHIPHCFGSDLSDESSLAYLNRGDLQRGMPGPLSQFAITDDGMLWLLGWGAANHTGYMEQGLHNLLLKDAAPLTADYKPTTSGTYSGGLHRVGPRYSGVEMCYGKAPTAAQIKTNELLSAALMHANGPEYTGGSLAGHRECTTQRGDPTGISMYQHRNAVNRLLKAGPPTPIVIKPPVVVTPPKPPEETDVALTKDEITAIAKAVWLQDGIVPSPVSETNPTGNQFWRAFSLQHDLIKRQVAQDKKIDALTKSVDALTQALAALPDALKQDNP